MQTETKEQQRTHIDLLTLDKSLYTPEFDPVALLERLKQLKIDPKRISHLGGARQVDAFLGYRQAQPTEDDEAPGEEKVVIRIYNKEDDLEIAALNKKQRQSVSTLEFMLNEAEKEEDVDFPYGVSVPRNAGGSPGCRIETYVSGQHIEDKTERDIPPAGTWRQVYDGWHRIYTLFNFLNKKEYAWFDFQLESIKLDPTNKECSGGLVDVNLIHQTEARFREIDAKNRRTLLNALGVAIGGKRDGHLVNGLPQLPQGLRSLLRTLSLDPSLLYTAEVNEALENYNFYECSSRVIFRDETEEKINYFTLHHFVKDLLPTYYQELQSKGMLMNPFKLWLLRDMVDELNYAYTTDFERFSGRLFENKSINTLIEEVVGSGGIDAIRGKLKDIPDRPAQYHMIYNRFGASTLKDIDPYIDHLSTLPSSPESLRLQLLHSVAGEDFHHQQYGKVRIGMILTQLDYYGNISRAQAIEQINSLSEEFLLIQDTISTIATQLKFDDAYASSQYSEAIALYDQLSPNMRRVADSYYASWRGFNTVVEQLTDLRNKEYKNKRQYELAEKYRTINQQLGSGEISNLLYTTQLAELSRFDPIGIYELMRADFLVLNLQDPKEGDHLALSRLSSSIPSLLISEKMTANDMLIIESLRLYNDLNLTWTQTQIAQPEITNLRDRLARLQSNTINADDSTRQQLRVLLARISAKLTNYP